MIARILTLFERHAFGVCAWWGEKLNMKTANVRLFFIYASFIAFVSPLIIYLIMAFILNIRNYMKSKRSSVWDL